jgi:hypothetical protein
VALGFQPPLFGGRCRLCPFARFGLFRCITDHFDQTFDGVLTVSVLGAEPPRVNDQYAFRCDPFAPQTKEAPANIIGQRGRVGDVEAELNGRSDLVDILSTWTGSTNKIQFNFATVN